jgi:hypothetical protein
MISLLFVKKRIELQFIFKYQLAIIAKSPTKIPWKIFSSYDAGFAI